MLPQSAACSSTSCIGSKGIAILICEKCGAEIPDGASYCARCEHPVSVAQIGPVYVPATAQPPETIPPLPPQTVTLVRLPYAGFWLRAAAFVADRIILFVILGPIFSAYPDRFIVIPNPTGTSLSELPHPTWLAYGLMFVVFWAYYALFHSSEWQATPGKRVFRLYVTDMEGRRITFWRASIRYFCTILSEIAFWVGYFIAGFTEKKQALHDLLANTLVLRRR